MSLSGTAHPVARAIDVPFLAWRRAVTAALLPFGGVLLHAAAISVDGRGLAFIGPSGRGKSTHAGLWQRCFGEAVVMVNDDMPFARLAPTGPDGFNVHAAPTQEEREALAELAQYGVGTCQDEASAYIAGSPWMGKRRLGACIERPLVAIVALTRGRENRFLGRLPEADALVRLFPQVYAIAGREAGVTDILLRLIRAVPVCELVCTKEPEAATVCRDGLERLCDSRSGRLGT